MTDWLNALKKVFDFRRPQGKRHPLWLVLIIVIAGFMSGYTSYRGIASLAKGHENTVCALFKITSAKEPSLATFGRVMIFIGNNKLLEIFNQWAGSFLKNEQKILG